MSRSKYSVLVALTPPPNFLTKLTDAFIFIQSFSWETDIKSNKLIIHRLDAFIVLAGDREKRQQPDAIQNKFN